MGTAWFAALCLLICMFQASILVTAEEPTCAPGFESDMLIFKVFRNHLKRSTRLGKVGFTDCTDRTRFVFSSDDSHFMVQTDGILKVNREVDIRQRRDFFIHSWDSQGHKMSVPVRVVYYEHSHGNSHQMLSITTISNTLLKWSLLVTQRNHAPTVSGKESD